MHSMLRDGGWLREKDNFNRSTMMADQRQISNEHVSQTPGFQGSIIHGICLLCQPEYFRFDRSF